MGSDISILKGWVAQKGGGIENKKGDGKVFPYTFQLVGKIVVKC